MRVIVDFYLIFVKSSVWFYSFHIIGDKWFCLYDGLRSHGRQFIIYTGEDPIFRPI